MQISKVLNSLIDSFSTGDGGFSARKLSAFAGVATCVYVTLKYIEVQYLAEVLTIWLAFALLCMGIVTIEQIIKLKNGNNTTETTEETSSSKTTSTSEP